MKHLTLGLCLALLCLANGLAAQGPPIMADSPIMLGAQKTVIRSYLQYRSYSNRDVLWAPLMVDYTVTSSLQVGTTVPLAHELGRQDQAVELGDAMMRLKYQFYRKDRPAHTFRASAVVRQWLPTGKDVDNFELGTGAFRTHLAVIAGIEDVRYGLQSELGYVIQTDHMADMAVGRLSFGLPFLQPVFPVKQLTLYFEYEGMYMRDGRDHYAVLYAQGIQYARKRWTFDASAEFSLAQHMPPTYYRRWGMMAGARVVI